MIIRGNAVFVNSASGEEGRVRSEVGWFGQEDAYGACSIGASAILKSRAGRRYFTTVKKTHVVIAARIATATMYRSNFFHEKGNTLCAPW